MTTRYDAMTRAELLRTIAMQQRQIAMLSHSRHFGVSTREALELALEGADLSGYAIIFWDIDNLKAYNAQYTMPVSSSRIGDVIKTRAGDLLAGQWYSGDEFAAFVPQADAAGFAARLLAGLREIESSATIAIDAWIPDVPTILQVDALTVRVGHMKNAGQRGVIRDLRAERFCTTCDLQTPHVVTGGSSVCRLCGEGRAA